MDQDATELQFISTIILMLTSKCRQKSSHLELVLTLHKSEEQNGFIKHASYLQTVYFLSTEYEFIHIYEIPRGCNFPGC